MAANEQQASRNYRRLVPASIVITLVVVSTALLYVYRNHVAELGPWGYLRMETTSSGVSGTSNNDRRGW